MDSQYQDILLIVIFVALVLVAGWIDLFSHQSRKRSIQRDTLWSVVWVGLGLSFTLVIWLFKSDEPDLAYAYLSAFLIEKMLSIDNLFVFILIFSMYEIKKEHEHKILFWGILGAIVFRAIFIFVGVWLVEIANIDIMWYDTKYVVNALLTFFGFFLIYTSLKISRKKNSSPYKEGRLIRLIKRVIPVASDYRGDSFYIRRGTQIYITPLLLALISIELTDVLFALDSIPAIFSITSDRLVLYTSNIFAILGLRALYFLIANLLHLFSFVKHALVLILFFVGTKMVIAPVLHIPVLYSLLTIVCIFVASYLFSYLRVIR